MVQISKYSKISLVFVLLFSFVPVVSLNLSDKVEAYKPTSEKSFYYVCSKQTRAKKTKVNPNGTAGFVYGTWTETSSYNTDRSEDSKTELSRTVCKKTYFPSSTSTTSSTSSSSSSESDPSEGNVSTSSQNYGGAGSADLAGNTLSCKNVTNQFSKFYDYVNSKYKAVKTAGTDANKKNKDAWVATDKALFEQRAKEDTNVQATKEKLTKLAGSDADKITATTNYIDALIVAIQDNRHFSDIARAGVDLTADTLGASQDGSYRLQVIAAINDKRTEYKGFMKKLVSNYDNATTAAKKNCSATTLNKLKKDTTNFKSSYKTDLAKARETYKKSLAIIRDEYKKQIGQSKIDLQVATDKAFETLLAEW